MKKQTFGESIIEGLTELADALEKKEKLDERFTCRQVFLDLNATEFDAKLVRDTREILRASQSVFARFLGVSTKTVQAWESGQNAPNDMACRFMDEIRRDPTYWKKRFQSVLVGKTSRSKGLAKTK